MRIVVSSGLFVSFAVLVASCGSKSKSENPPPPGSGADASAVGAEYNAQYKQIIVNNCGACHGAGSEIDLSTFEKVKARRADMLSEISGGDMPLSPKPQWASNDKAKMIEYLTNSSDFK